MSRLNIGSTTQKRLFCFIIFCILAVGLAVPAAANDTDIYQVDTKQNCYILMDNSGSMGFPVYSSGVDYGAMYDYLFAQGNIDDPVTNGKFYQNHLTRTKIYLIEGPVGLTTATIDGQSIAFTGDAGDYQTPWGFSNIVDTHTLIDQNGNLSWDGTGSTTQRVTEDADGHILFDGARLPMGQDIQLHDMVTLTDGSQVDNGFAGLMNAPGQYFSGYDDVNNTVGYHQTAQSGDKNIYFFATGNWINMETVLNLAYNDGTSGSPWQNEAYPLPTTDWSTMDYSYQYPQSGDYSNNVSKTLLTTITSAGATQIQVHFSSFDVNAVQASTQQNVCNKWGWCKTQTTTDAQDWVYLDYTDSNGNNQELKYNNDTPPPSGGWSAAMDASSIGVYFSSGSQNPGAGFVIDKIKVTYSTGSYTMETRLDVAKEAMLYVTEAFKGKLNWGFATFNNGDGAKLLNLLNPTISDDTNEANIVQHINQLTAGGGTPLGEALQDVFEKGYYQIRNSLDNLPCRKNYIITVSDGYPSEDSDWSRISGVTINDADHDGWTEDPMQYTNPPNDYYDDVAAWIYTHSWKDLSSVADPANSTDNVITDNIAFSANQELLKDASKDGGGHYIVAYNKAQLVAAFYSLALEMMNAVSFTAPVVSVNAANKIQNGDYVYVGFFKPQDAQSWVGNVKKYRLGDGSTARPDTNMLYDMDNNPALDANGDFKDNLTGFWGDDTTVDPNADKPNDHDNYGTNDVEEDGVGEVLTDRVAADLASGNYYERKIYTYINGAMVLFNQTNITAADLNVADDATRNQIINYVYGYTDAADATTGAPLACRSWALGSIIHSNPTVVDYYDTTQPSLPLKARYIVVGSNDGMLHVFDDTTGEEVFAFIPPGILPKLQLLPSTPLVDTVDGGITLYRLNKNPKYLIFGLRRGGGAYWCLDVGNSDPTQWTVAWQYTNSEIVQSWAKPQVASIPVGVDPNTGKISFQDIVIFTGGYDPLEDSYPEPFDDLNHDGTPYQANGSIDPNEWSKNDPQQDVNGNGQYDRWNPGIDNYGRGIFAVDINDPANQVYAGAQQVLPFSVTYASMPSMTYCFPATPAVITSMYSYNYKNGTSLDTGSQSNVFRFAYAPDIYANIYKLVYDFNITGSSGSYAVATGSGWEVTKVFSGNPGSTNPSGTFDRSSTMSQDDQGRKTFYAPAVSWGGACDYFDAGNYSFPETTFFGQNDIAALFIGTGDREHPSYTMIKNRLYAIWDDTSMSAQKDDGSSVTVSTAPYDENDLLNLTCDELDTGTLSTISKSTLTTTLTDDATLSGLQALENGNEDDAKGWYIILADQGNSSYCSDCTNVVTADHTGEKILSPITLYAGGIYFTSYQPAYNDPCNPKGNGFVYGLSYCDGTSYLTNDHPNDNVMTDRYIKITNIDGIPSGFVVINRLGGSDAMSMMGGQLVNLKPKDSQLGINLYYWREN